jgi:VanZ family protein
MRSWMQQATKRLPDKIRVKKILKGWFPVRINLFLFRGQNAPQIQYVNTMAKHRILWIAASIGWLIICTVLLCMPGSAFPESSWLDNIPLFDKWVHIGMFAIMTFLICKMAKVLDHATKKTFILIALFCFAYGVLMEFVQHYWIPYRSFDGWDMVADGIGATVGLLAMRVVTRRRY